MKTTIAFVVVYSFALYWLGGCVGEYDPSLFSNVAPSLSCQLEPNVFYGVQDSNSPNDSPRHGLIDQYLPKDCSTSVEVCKGNVLTIACREYLETWTVVDRSGDTLFVTAENHGPLSTVFYNLTITREDDDAGTEP